MVPHPTAEGGGAAACRAVSEGRKSTRSLSLFYQAAVTTHATFTRADIERAAFVAPDSRERALLPAPPLLPPLRHPATGERARAIRASRTVGARSRLQKTRYSGIHLAAGQGLDGLAIQLQITPITLLFHFRPINISTLT